MQAKDSTRHRTTTDTASLPDELQALRESVLHAALLVLAIAVPLVSMIVLIQEAVRGELTLNDILRFSFTLVFPVLAWLNKRLPFTPMAVLLLAFLVITGFLVSVRGGISTGNLLASVIALVLGSLFFGRPGAIGTFLGVIASFSLAGVLLTNGVMAPPDPELWNQLSGAYWLRQVIIFVLFGMALVITQLYINERLIAMSAKTRQMAEQDRLQRIAMEESRRLEALSRLSGGIAHDFNNTLVVMLGNAELALMDLDDKPEAREAVQKIIAAGSAASDMTRQLLTIGRKGQTSPELIALDVVLGKVGGALERLMPHNVELDISVTGTPTCFADPVMFERALFNLVLNAMDAMPDGGTIRVTCEDDGENRQVLLVVDDEGVGMDAETLSHIFDPYFTTKSKSGTGLGLAILRAWAESSGGEIVVRSAPGQGSTFTMRLPANTPG